MTMGAATAADDVLRALVEAESSPTAILDPDGRVRLANPPFANLLGLADGLPAPLAAPLRDRFGGKLPAPLDAYLDDLARAEASDVGAVVDDPVDGQRYLFRSHRLGTAESPLGWRVRLTPLRAGAEGDDGDVTLAEICADHERQLIAKDQMIAGVSHELRTPMTAIIGFCHMLLHYGDGMDEVQAGFVQKVLKNASILLQLLNNVLDIAREQAGEMQLSVEAVDVEAICAEAVETIEPLTWEKDLTVRVELGDLPDAHTDRLKLKRILINLLSNAVKYTETGEVVLRAASDDGGIRLEVADSGCGIPADQLERIFEPYVRAHSPTSQTPSTGLGLSICRVLAKYLEGRLEVDSVVDEGSTFRLWIPLAITETAAAEG